MSKAGFKISNVLPQKTLTLLGYTLAWSAVAIQLILSTLGATDTITATINYFSFFTILSNIAVALAYTAALTTRPKLFNSPAARAAIAVYILVTGVIFFLLLRDVYRPTGLGFYVNILLHYINPPLYLAHWFFTAPKQSLRYTQLPSMLIFPLVYGAYTLAHGAITGWYPYPFLDAHAQGYPRTLINIAGLTVVFIVLSASFVALGRALSHPTKQAPG